MKASYHLNICRVLCRKMSRLELNLGDLRMILLKMIFDGVCLMGFELGLLRAAHRDLS
jgi:hypothetical protein